MRSRPPWSTLGLTPTADALAIKRAYAVLLRQSHPEDDPEGFQRLHAAYREALALAAGREARTPSRRSPTPPAEDAPTPAARPPREPTPPPLVIRSEPAPAPDEPPSPTPEPTPSPAPRPRSRTERRPATAEELAAAAPPPPAVPPLQRILLVLEADGDAAAARVLDALLADPFALSLHERAELERELALACVQRRPSPMRLAHTAGAAFGWFDPVHPLRERLPWLQELATHARVATDVRSELERVVDRNSRDPGARESAMLEAQLRLLGQPPVVRPWWRGPLREREVQKALAEQAHDLAVQFGPGWDALLAPLAQAAAEQGRRNAQRGDRYVSVAVLGGFLSFLPLALPLEVLLRTVLGAGAAPSLFEVWFASSVALAAVGLVALDRDEHAQRDRFRPALVAANLFALATWVLGALLALVMQREVQRSDPTALIAGALGLAAFVGWWSGAARIQDAWQRHVLEPLAQRRARFAPLLDHWRNGRVRGWRRSDLVLAAAIAIAAPLQTPLLYAAGAALLLAVQLRFGAMVLSGTFVVVTLLAGIALAAGAEGDGSTQTLHLGLALALGSVIAYALARVLESPGPTRAALASAPGLIRLLLAALVGFGVALWDPLGYGVFGWLAVWPFVAMAYGWHYGYWLATAFFAVLTGSSAIGVWNDALQATPDAVTRQTLAPALALGMSALVLARMVGLWGRALWARVTRR